MFEVNRKIKDMDLNPPEPPLWDPYGSDEEWNHMKEEYRLQLEAYKAKGDFIEKIAKANELPIDLTKLSTYGAIILVSTIQLILVLRFESSGVIGSKGFTKILKIPMAL